MWLGAATLAGTALQKVSVVAESAAAQPVLEPLPALVAQAPASFRRNPLPEILRKVEPIFPCPQLGTDELPQGS